jgi:uncharacterized membrane protein
MSIACRAATSVSKARVGRRTAASLASITSVSGGLLGAAADYCFLAATGAGQLTAAAVLAGLYPAVTVLLAVLILRERPRIARAAGLVGAGAAVTAMAAG